MATHGRNRSALGHFFLGSVAEQVVRQSTCPVLVVPPRR
jgi:nucleotide-binding universal stress UspA family protein